ncbi:hypothetical protein IMCC26207_104138 [Actinobacteria bacterium IMCC26207]|nr:hypothetical protein IMCC26207_104138 [Actinobacteria bacterium IMCC26207]
MTFDHRITRGHLLRHIPPNSMIGVDVATLDVAQDFLLAHLHAAGMFDLVVFKGGTALRKLFAGTAGRFSTDIDLAIATPDEDRRTVADLVAETIDDASAGPFRYRVENRRGRWLIHVDTDLANVAMPLKLDVGPPCWLAPDVRSFVPVPIHDRFDFALPDLPTMSLEENLAEKVARLNRVAAARDASDLVWAATTTPFSGTDRNVVRRLAVLKIWVDVNGLNGHWHPTSSTAAFDPSLWLRTGREWDDESIGLLAHPPPPIEVLESDMVRLWKDLANLTVDEAVFAAANEKDRSAVIAAIFSLPSAAVSADELWRVQ